MAIPTIPQVDIRWALAMHKILDATPYKLTYAADWKYGIAQSREKLAEAALVEKTVTHIMFWDSDVLPQRIDVVKTLIEDDQPIISGIYANSLHTGINAWVSERTIDLKQPADILPVDKVGMGLCMIKREVFEAITTKPWFYMKPYGPEMKGEDFYFLEQAAKFGFKPKVDMRVKAYHIKATCLDVDGMPAGEASF